MASHVAPQAARRAQEETGPPSASAASGFAQSAAGHGLDRTAALLNARPTIVAQRALGERLSAARSPRGVGRAVTSGQMPVQRKLLYPDSEWEAGKTTIREFGDDNNALINAAEPTQLPELADSLGQDFVKYTPGNPPDLTDERINYLVGHVGFGNGGQDMLDPYWAGLGPNAIVSDLIDGNIKNGSALKILGCLGGVSLAPQIATRLAAQGKGDISVIASSDIVHATGKGIVSFPMKKAREDLTDAYATRNNSGKKLVKGMSTARKELQMARAKLLVHREAAQQKIDGGEDQALVEQQYRAETAELRKEIAGLLNGFVTAGGEHFDRTVKAFSEGYGIEPSHNTPGNQGWRKFVGSDVPQDLTAEDERHDRPAPQGEAEIEAPPPLEDQAALDQAQPAILPQLLPQPIVPVQHQQPQHGPHHFVGVDATHDHPLM